ncbi:MAG: sensor histidine kinase [Chloroflexota bacterium]
MDEKSSVNRPCAEAVAPDQGSRHWRRLKAGWPVARNIQGTLLVLLLVVLIPVLITQAIVYKFRLQARRTQEIQANLELARSVAGIFDAYVHDVLHQELAIGLDLTSTPGLSSAQMNEVLMPNVQEYPSVRGFGWVDPAGRVIASSNPAAIGVDLKDLDLFTSIASGQPWAVSDLFQSKIDRQPVFLIGRSIRGPDQEMLGIVIASVDPNRLGAILMVSRGGQGAISVIDQHGREVYHFPEIALTWEQRDWLPAEPSLRTALTGGEVAGTYPSPIDGQTRLGGVTPIASIHWVVAADHPEAEVTAADLRDLIGSFALVLVVGLIAFVVALRTSRTLTIPIGRLREDALAVGRGELDRRVEVTGPRELEDLADAFNRMAAEIRAQEAKREEYIHTISHDLRAPLAIIQGHAHLLESELPRSRRGGPDQRSIDAILKGVHRMNAMLQDLVDSARLEAGQLHLNPELVDLSAFVYDLGQRLVGLDRARRIALDLPDGLPPVLVDPDRLERVLMNLIINALKYAAPDTPVGVTLRRHDGEAILTVSDHGPGITPEEISELFQPYGRTRAARDNRDSVGLGLYIVRRLVEASGGRIWAESEPGQGSRFSVSFPLEEGQSVTHESSGGIHD